MQDRIWPYAVYFEHITNTIQVNKRFKTISFNSSKHCIKNQPCRKIYKLQADEKSYTEIKISNLGYIGWNIAHCLYGGVSFWEHEPNKIQHRYPHGMRETLTLCDNYTNIQSESFN